MLKIHRPIACLIGAVILVVSVFLYQEQIHEYVRGANRPRLIGIYSSGIVVGVLTILYGLIPGRTKE